MLEKVVDNHFQPSAREEKKSENDNFKEKSWYFPGFGAESGSVISRNGSKDPDPDPYQNEPDPKHCGFIFCSRSK